MTTSIHFISAGAGSGKTYRLTQLLHAALTDQSTRPGGVLATTFTKKAAAELNDRVRADLLAHGRHDLANAMGQALIGTVNSVCGELLKRFAFELGLSCHLQVLDEQAADGELRKAIDAVGDQASAEALAEVAYRLDIEDWTESVGRLVHCARANHIGLPQLVEFGRLNADELLNLYPAPSEDAIDAGLLAAIDRALPRILAIAQSEQKKNTNEYVRELSSFRKRLCAGTAKWCDWARLAKATPQASLKGDVKDIQELAGLYCRHPQLHEDLRRYLVLVFEMAARACELYAAAKKERGAIDFTDQEALLLAGLDHPEVGDVLREELDLLLVDEFQDTSPIQLALFLKMASFAKKTYWVGDVKQAIYGFRGSDTALMKSLLDQLPGLGGTKEVLDCSWRSRPALVSAVNDLFVPAFQDILPAGDVALVPARQEHHGGAAIMHWKLQGRSLRDHAAAIAEGTDRLVSSGYAVHDKAQGGMRPVRYADIAILARKNDHVVAITDALRSRGVPVATSQSGLLAQPETVLALACLRRVLDPNDTLATAEIVSLAECAEPEAWLADRLAWLQADKPSRSWKEEGYKASPLLSALAGLRQQILVLSPREAVQAVVVQADVAARAMRWCADEQSARARLANIGALLDTASEYEDSCAAAKTAATAGGLLIWLDDLAHQGKDFLGAAGIDAVRVLTHHAAKGLEWPVTLLHGLDEPPRDNPWGISCTSRGDVVATQPLRGRHIRYWPWPFGKQKTVVGVDGVTASATARARQASAQAEEARLLYVSMTRARDALVLAVPAGKELPWLQSVQGQRLLDGEGHELALSDGTRIPYSCWDLPGPQCPTPSPGRTALHWYAMPPGAAAGMPAVVSPSAAAALPVQIEETVELGARIALTGRPEMDQLGTAIHACMAFGLGPNAARFSVADVQRILKAHLVHGTIDGVGLHRSIVAFREWVATRWPDSRTMTEVPIEWKMLNGQLLSGQIDLLVDTGTAWVVVDHKSNPEPRSEWERKADEYSGQLQSYARALEEVTNKPVDSCWLHFPVSGGAARIVTQRRRDVQIEQAALLTP